MNANDTKPSELSQSLLGEIKRTRRSAKGRSLIFIAHSFGGLVVAQVGDSMAELIVADFV